MGTPEEHSSKEPERDCEEAGSPGSLSAVNRDGTSGGMRAQKPQGRAPDSGDELMLVESILARAGSPRNLKISSLSIGYSVYMDYFIRKLSQNSIKDWMARGAGLADLTLLDYLYSMSAKEPEHVRFFSREKSLICDRVIEEFVREKAYGVQKQSPAFDYLDITIDRKIAASVYCDVIQNAPSKRILGSSCDVDDLRALVVLDQLLGRAGHEKRYRSVYSSGACPEAMLGILAYKVETERTRERLQDEKRRKEEEEKRQEIHRKKLEEKRQKELLAIQKKKERDRQYRKKRKEKKLEEERMRKEELQRLARQAAEAAAMEERKHSLAKHERIVGQKRGYLDERHAKARGFWKKKQANMEKRTKSEKRNARIKENAKIAIGRAAGFFCHARELAYSMTLPLYGGLENAGRGVSCAVFRARGAAKKGVLDCYGLTRQWMSGAADYAGRGVLKAFDACYPSCVYASWATGRAAAGARTAIRASGQVLEGRKKIAACIGLSAFFFAAAYMAVDSRKKPADQLAKETSHVERLHRISGLLQLGSPLGQDYGASDGLPYERRQSVGELIGQGRLEDAVIRCLEESEEPRYRNLPAGR